MALVCSTSVIQYEQFEFIDCSSINVSYAQNGMASVSFVVISTFDALQSDYSELTFGKVKFVLYLRDIIVSLIPGTLVYTYQMTMTGFGCRE